MIIKPAISEVLFAEIIKHDVASAIKLYHDLKTNQSDKYDFSESQLNDLGYQLLGMKKNKEAIEILKLNVEAYLTDGQTDAAITNYKKTLEINPANPNAVEVLRKLGANK